MHRPLRPLPLLVALVTSWLSIAVVRAEEKPAPPAPGSAGAAMPAVELPSVGPHALAADATRGKVVLYEFWATWCTPCHVQVEILNELYPAAVAAGIEFVGVASGEPADLVVEHLAKHPSPYPQLLDGDEKLGMAIEILALPTLVIVDRDGKISWRETGITDRSTLVDAFAAAGAPVAPAGPASTTPSAPVAPVAIGSTGSAAPR